MNNLREKLGCPIVQLSEETREIASELSRIAVFYSDDRGRILKAIEHSGWFFEIAEDGLGRGKRDPLATERKQQAVLKAAGIVDDATAIAWMDSVRGAIESDRAEYDALLKRHRAEISEFLEHKRGGK